MLKIIANPPFKINKKKFVALLNKADDYVVLHTFRFCNNELGRFELIMPEEWPDVACSKAISTKYMHYNKETLPVFFLKKLTLNDKEDFDKYYYDSNTNYTNYKCANRYKRLTLDEVTEQSFIAKSSCRLIKKGETKNFIWVVPKKDYSKYEEQIFIDSYKWGDPIKRQPLIRQEFVDENSNEPSI